MTFLCLLSVFNVHSVYAVEEPVLPKKFHAEILPFFEAARNGSVIGKDGIHIAWRAFPPANGGTFHGARALIISNGRSESMRKYAELIYDLQRTGYAIYILDHRGQGESGKMLTETQKGHVRNFRDYVEDFGTFLNEVVLKDSPSEIHVLGHSMGATIATIYAIEHPGAFRSMVFSAPMYQPNLGSYSEWMALAISGFMRLIGRGTDLAPGRTLDEWKNPFEGNFVTQSANRYAYAQQILEAHPDTAIGGPTYSWVQEAIRGGRWIRKNAEYLTIPTRILQASDEHVVMKSFQNEVCGKAKACEIEVIEGSKHEMLMESDAYRNRAIELALDWVNKHGS